MDSVSVGPSNNGAISPGKPLPAPPPAAASPRRGLKDNGEVSRRTWQDGFSAEEYHKESGFVVVDTATGEDDDVPNNNKVASWFRSVFKKEKEKDDSERRDKRRDHGSAAGSRSNSYSSRHQQGVVPSVSSAAAAGTSGVSGSSLSRAISEPFRASFLGIPPPSPTRISTSSRSSNSDRNSDEFDRDNKKPPKASAFGRTFSESTNDSQSGSLGTSPVVATVAGATSMGKFFEKVKTGLQKAPSVDFHSTASLQEDPRLARGATERPYSYANGLGSVELWPGLAVDREPGVDAPISRRTSLSFGHGGSASTQLPPQVQMQPMTTFASQQLKQDSLRRRASPIPALSRSRSNKTEIKTLHATPWGRQIDPIRLKEDLEFVGVMKSRQLWGEESARASAAVQLGAAATPLASPGNASMVSPVEAAVVVAAVVDSKIAALSPIVEPAPANTPVAGATSPAGPASSASLLSRMGSITEKEDRVEKEKRFENMVRQSRLASLKGDSAADMAEDHEEKEEDEALLAAAAVPAAAAMAMSPSDAARLAETKPLPVPEPDAADTLHESPAEQPPPVPDKASDKPPMAPVSQSLMALLSSSKSTPMSLSLTPATLPRTSSVVTEDDLAKALVAEPVSPETPPALPPRKDSIVPLPPVALEPLPDLDKI